MFTDKIFINCEQCESNLQNLKSATIGEYSGWNFRDFVVTQIKIFKIFSSSQPRSVQWQNLVVRPKKGEKKTTVNLNSYKRTLTSQKWDWAILTNLSTKDLLRGLGQGYPSTRCDSISCFYKHEKNVNNKQIQKKNT